MESVTDNAAAELDAMALSWCAALHDPDRRTMAEYGRDEVRGASALSETRDFVPEATPWVVQPVNDCHLRSPVRKAILIKPTQAGGTRGGEVVCCNWLDKAPADDIGYWWPSDTKVASRWEKYFRPLLLASSVSERLPTNDNTRFKNGVILTPRLNFQMLGVESKKNTASDSIRWAVLEEVHLWKDGQLQVALGRMRAYLNKLHKIFIISNASYFEGQLHRAFIECTQQHWEVKCPGCGLYHRMRTKWDEREPHLGGLRYDAEGCRLPGGHYNYTRLAETIRFQFPCGFQQRDNEDERKALSRTGRYSDPTNVGALLTDRSYILEGVAVHYLPWLYVIKEKHKALRALRNGDLQPWIDYVKEIECGFYNKKEIPGSQRIEITTTNRDTAEKAERPESAMRFAFVDYQHGKSRRGDVNHFWMVVRDFWRDAGRMKSRLVFAGRLDTESDVEMKREELGVEARFVGVDCGHEQTIIFVMCARFGYFAFKGMGTDSGERKQFPHYETDEKGEKFRVMRIYSEGEYRNVGQGQHDGSQREGVYVGLIKFCKQSIRDRFDWVLNSGECDYEIPDDAPDDYKQHLRNEDLIEGRNGIERWEDYGRDVDLKVCDMGCLLQAEMAGFVGAAAEDLRKPEPQLSTAA